jgi:hypothetical protein
MVDYWLGPQWEHISDDNPVRAALASCSLPKIDDQP